MAKIDSQKQFLTLIRGFASESSQGERRIVDLKKRSDELRYEIGGANAELEDAKRVKEMTEQDIKGYEVELAMKEASIQTLEARVGLIQNEVAVSKSELEALKIEEGCLRDDFIERMLRMNATIRKFQETSVYAFNGNDCLGTSKKEDAKVVRRSLEDNLAQIVSQTIAEEQKYLAEQNIHNQAQQELIQLEEKLDLMEAVLRESKELQELTRQTSEFEVLSASLGNDLQNRCLCPSCHRDNVEALGGILQASSGS
ncbi:Spindle assembly checkpoint component [Heracleum sosnowskyi]|uniref:Spindle assembly checkpoint component n=1 Tax=Heracleum sosnowskyi TaxID=360622 RepID=A0AAD8MTU0_9APIA|nr:Spindle assembly checkpoint component [Heracleum sosnowskyi]